MGPTLASLVTKDLLRRVQLTLPDAEALRFRHILIRDAAYEGIPKSVRADLHERFAGWFEGILGDRVPEYQEILGYHLERAHRLWTELGVDGEVPDTIAAAAAVHLGDSGRRAAARGDIGAATDLLRRAADLLPELDAVASSSSSSSGCRWPTPGARRRRSTRPCARPGPAGTRGSGGGLSSAWPRSSAGRARTRTSPRWRTSPGAR